MRKRLLPIHPEDHPAYCIGCTLPLQEDRWAKRLTLLGMRLYLHPECDFPPGAKYD